MVKIPDTPLIVEALSLARASLSDNLFNHSMRTFHYGNEYARKYKINHSEEELMLVSLFHDVGFYSPFSLEGKPFQIASSKALKNYLLKNHNIETERVNAMMEAIDYHFQFMPRWDKGEIAGILQVGTHMDVIGKRIGSIEKSKKELIQNGYPKKGFFKEFNTCLLKSFTGIGSVLGLFFPKAYCGSNHYIH